MSEAERLWERLRKQGRLLDEIGAMEPRMGSTYADDADKVDTLHALDIGGYNVKAYGAVGDGATHPLSGVYANLAAAQAVYSFASALTQELDYCAWQAAINAAEAAGGGLVFGPAGTYLIDTALVNDDDNVTIAGMGFSTCLKTRTAATVSHILRIKGPDAATQIVGWSVRDIRFDGNKNGTTTTTSKCLRVVLTDVDAPAYGLIRNVWAHGASDSGSPASGNEGGGIAITSQAVALGAHYWQGVIIEGCHCWDNGDSNAWGIGLNSNRGVAIIGCQCWDNESMGITCWDSQDVTIQGCVSHDNAFNEINIESSDRVTIGGCVAYCAQNESVLGVKIANSVDVTLSDCVVEIDSNSTSSACVRVRTVDAVATQIDRASAHIQIAGCLLKKANTAGATGGYVIWLDDKPTGGAMDPANIRVRNCEIVNAQSVEVYQGVYGDAVDIEITGNHIESGILLVGLDSGVTIKGNTIKAEFEAGTARNVIRLNDTGGNVYDRSADVNENEFICDSGALDSVAAVVYYAAGYCYTQFNGNAIKGKVNYVLQQGAGVTSPSCRGNLIGGLTVDTALHNCTFPPSAGTWPTGATVWCDLDTSGYQFWYTWNGTAWIKLGMAVTYDDIPLPLINANLPGANTPAVAALTANTSCLTFAIGDYANPGTAELKHKYAEGTNLDVHLHIITNGSDVAACKARYIVYYTIGDMTEVMAAEANMTAELTIPGGTTDRTHLYLDMGDIVGATYKIGALIQMRVKRLDNSDHPGHATFAEPTADPFVANVGIHYQINSPGSSAETTK